jgi:hypothetical protein
MFYRSSFPAASICERELCITQIIITQSDQYGDELSQHIPDSQIFGEDIKNGEMNTQTDTAYDEKCHELFIDIWSPVLKGPVFIQCEVVHDCTDEGNDGREDVPYMKVFSE